MYIYSIQVNSCREPLAVKAHNCIVKYDSKSLPSSYVTEVVLWKTLMESQILV